MMNYGQQTQRFLAMLVAWHYMVALVRHCTTLVETEISFIMLGDTTPFHLVLPRHTEVLSEMSEQLLNGLT